MPTLRFVERYPHPIDEIFDFFRRPANVVALSPDDLDIRLLEGPEEVSSGDRFAVQVRRFGLSRRVVTEVVNVEEPSLLVERQVEGPFRAWQVERRFSVVEGGTEVTETITFEPPTGLLGLMLTVAVVEQELTQAFAGRAERVTRRLSAS
jgi:ligand-binding SRPBCC domain-containing protein